MIIAIVVVSLNCLPALQRTVASIRALADPRVTPIFIDGASTDGSAQYVLGLRPWAAHAASAPDSGIYDAMNKGWQAASPQAHVLYLGAGDLVFELPSNVEMHTADGRPADVILGRCSIGDTPFSSRWGHEMRLRNTAHHQAMLIRKAVWPDPPFDTTLRIYGDWDFNLRLMQRGVRAHQATGLRTMAAPGGVSWRHELSEIRTVATRHGGPLAGTAAFLLNGVSRWRRDRSATRHAVPT